MPTLPAPGARLERTLASLLRQQQRLQQTGAALSPVEALAVEALPAALHRLGRWRYDAQTVPGELPPRPFWLDLEALAEAALPDYAALLHDGDDARPLLVYAPHAHAAAEEMARRLVPLLAAYLRPVPTEAAGDPDDRRRDPDPDPDRRD